MAGFWDSYVALNDDVRRTYEQVFYGQQLTEPYGGASPDPGNFWNGTNGAPADGAPGIEPMEQAADVAHDYSDFYQNTFSAGAPQIEAPTIDAAPVEAPQIEAPPVEAPPIEPPAPAAPSGPDMTPG